MHLIKNILKLFLILTILVSASSVYAEQFSNGFVYPVNASRLSSVYGKRFHPVHKYHRHHSGVDLAAPKSTPIRSVSGGVVIFADYYAGYGNYISIKHENGLTTHYGHCNEIKVSIGQKVKAGQVIGTIGSTGVVTGPHLHFEIRKNGVPKNPEKYIKGLRTKALG